MFNNFQSGNAQSKATLFKIKSWSLEEFWKVLLNKFYFIAC